MSANSVSGHHGRTYAVGMDGRLLRLQSDSFVESKPKSAVDKETLQTRIIIPKSSSKSIAARMVDQGRYVRRNTTSSVSILDHVEPKVEKDRLLEKDRRQYEHDITSWIHVKKQGC